MTTFCNVPLSTSLDPLSRHSRVSLDWILSSGVPASKSSASGILTLPCGDTMCSMHMTLSIAAGLPYDLVLSRDWLFFCHETLPHVSFSLSSGIVGPGQLSSKFTSVKNQCASGDRFQTLLSRPKHPRLKHFAAWSTRLHNPLDVDASAMNLWFAAAPLRLVLPLP
ncbi:hypothetical protein DFH07DRAFT_823288 [Mycena maculata]|uniref:Uncharacterized protein n=1 Tax=Mycena maculata TaxID=230809 RepID=A0AAD7NAZ2_9AGAR|nr:hypothetical protein DFH07DRAFT_823288 [Mycena maculata]